jgi:hypothetical protein
MEEAQHAKLDTLMVEGIVAGCRDDEIEIAVQEYLELGMMFDDALKQQTTLDMEAFCRATGRVFSKTDQDEFMTIQHQANRWTYLGTGMTHPNVLATVESFSPPSRARISQIAPAFC